MSQQSMQSDFSSFDNSPPPVHTGYHHRPHPHHTKPPASSFSLFKTMLITGPLVFILALVGITASIPKQTASPTPEILYQQQADEPSAIPSTPGYIMHHRDLCEGALQLVSIGETPQCRNSVNTVDATAYQTNYKIQNMTSPGSSSRRFQVTIRANSYFCLSGSGTGGDGKPTCTDNIIPGTLQTFGLGPQEAKMITISRQPKQSLLGVNGSPVCGSYQEELYVATVLDSDTGATCSLPVVDHRGEALIGSGVCLTKTDCATTSP